MFGTNYVYVRPQNDSIFHERASQDFHIVLGEAQRTFIHLPTTNKGNYLPICITWPCAQHDPIPWVLIQSKLHLLANMQ
jgi:hypothetical protein